MPKLLLLLECLIFSHLVKADATPKMNPRIEIEFHQNGKRVTNFDSIVCLVKYKSKSSPDTLTLYNVTGRWWEIGGIGKSANKSYKLEFRKSVEYFRIEVLKDEVAYKSKKVFPISTWSYLKFEMIGDSLSQNDTFFYTKWSNYALSFLITVFLELFLIFFFKSFRKVALKAVFIIFFANLITHPILWYFDTNYESNVVILELGVMLVECVLLSILLTRNIKFGTVIFYVVSANLLSWLIGGIIYWMNVN